MKNEIASAVGATSIEQITDGPEFVFRIKSGEEEIFAKVISEKKAERLAELHTDIGLPEYEILRVNSNPVLISKSTSARPLYWALFFNTIPIFGSNIPLKYYCWQVGQHLGRLHTETYIDNRVKGCRKVTELEPSQLKRTILDKIPFSKELPYVEIHGDPTPHNIHTRGNQVWLLDFNFHESFALEDMAIFELGVELMIYRSPFCFDTGILINAFRDGYQSSGVHDNVPSEIKLFKKMQCIRLLEGYHPSITNRLLEILDRPKLSEYVN